MNAPAPGASRPDAQSIEDGLDQSPQLDPFVTSPLARVPTPEGALHQLGETEAGIISELHQSSFLARSDDVWTTSDGDTRTLQPIASWSDLLCIRSLDTFFESGGVDDKGYQILYRMCQIIWSLGHEVQIRKKVKLARAHRLAKFQWYCDALLQGTKMWQRSLKAQVRSVWEAAQLLPYPSVEEPYQDVEQHLELIRKAMSGLHRPSAEKAHLFQSILEHYSLNYNILYALHREKPDYGLRSVLPTADRVFRVLRKLPQYAIVADEQISKIEHVVQRLAVHCREDRVRQEQAIDEFNAMPPAEKLAAFEDIMREFNPDFIEWVNGPRGKSMSQQQFNASLANYREDFLQVIAVMIIYDECFDVAEKESGTEPVGFEQAMEMARRRKEAAEAKRGWIEALGLDPALLSDDDILSEPEREQDDFDALAELDRKKPSPTTPDSPGLLNIPAIDESDKAVLLERSSPAPNGQAILGSTDGYSGPCNNSYTTRTASGLPLLPPTEVIMGQILDLKPDSLHSAPAQRQGLHVSRSFAAVEDDLVNRRHYRSSTVPDAYTAASTFSSPRPPASFRSREGGAHRDGMHVPRIFTGSFSQLETDIRRLKLDKVKTPEDQLDFSQDNQHKVRDFAITPERSPSPSPSPVTLLFRREACLSKETELQNRVINGEVIRSRRPSTKVRAQTTDEATGGIDAWLAGRSDRRDSPTLAASPLPRPERKHTL